MVHPKCSEQDCKTCSTTSSPKKDLDLLVIGAGPHALSLITRLVDDDPDLMSEKQRGRIMEDGARRARNRRTVSNHLKKRFDATEMLPRTLVVDSNGKWMEQWRKDFKALDIRYLRSHQHMHPCPFDFQSLRVWAADERREDELKQMKHVDKERCRRAGYLGPYVVPSTRLFLDFCESLVNRYNCKPLLEKGTVVDVRILDGGEERMFDVRLDDGRCFRAHKVVCAMGPGPAFQGMLSTLPWWAEDLSKCLTSGKDQEEKEEDCVICNTICTRDEEEKVSSVSPACRVQHSFTLTPWLRDERNLKLLKDARILVIGGGQTAAHLVKVAVHRGKAKHITLCTRRSITLKPYDIDVIAVGDKRPKVLKDFHKLPSARDKLDFNKRLRGGGSISADVYRAMCESCSSHLNVLEECEVVQAHWVSSLNEIHVRFDGVHDISQFDYVWLATGGTLDLSLVPIFASLQSQHPIDTVEGLPVLQDDLSWAEDIPLYIMGVFAQLQLGADALNLAGARSGSVLVARALIEDEDDDDKPDA